MSHYLRGSSVFVCHIPFFYNFLITKVVVTIWQDVCINDIYLLIVINVNLELISSRNSTLVYRERERDDKI